MTEKIVIRPSSVDTFINCAHQWKRVFIDGGTSIPSTRAAIGTAIHKAAEVLWSDAMHTRKKDANVRKLTEAAMEAFTEEEQKGLSYDVNESRQSAAIEIVNGTEAFIEDIVPFVSIPENVEKRYTIEIADHPLIKAISGTVDYIGNGVLADLKTSKRKPTVANYSTQQSIYKILAVANGVDVKYSQIHGVVLKKVPEGTVLAAEVNEARAKTLVNNLLDTLEVYHTDKVDPDVLFRGNPKYYLCSSKYCAFYHDCKFSDGTK